MQVQEVWNPQRLKALTPGEVEALIPGLREMIVQTVAQTGGHLASNLGVVELTLALHRVFDSPRDKLLFDVGHQCYAHKILTGRGPLMHTLRQMDGIAGFPKRDESPHDAYGTGHASTAMSAALGMARARDLQGGNEHVVVVVGDGAFTGGMCYEALNDAGSRKCRLIVILNDNGMSIAPNVGAVSNHLTKLRMSRGWMGSKKAVSRVLLKVPGIGPALHGFLQRVKSRVRNLFVQDKLFQSFGFRYLGPIDGHDEAGLERMLNRAKAFDKPVLLHIVTQKGRGYAQAENNPSAAHGVAAFNACDGTPKVKAVGRSFGAAAGTLLTQLAQEDPRIVAITAAMADSTGLKPFSERFGDRLFDVGIAEDHAVTMAAGMAAAGMRPVVAVYDTFLQRAYDQLVVDVCLQGLPVCFLIDRAALGGDDGPTHHGIFGTAFMRHIPGLTLLAPRSVDELSHMMRFALEHDGPVAIRYPRSEPANQALFPATGFRPGRWETLTKGEDIQLIATGPMVAEAIKAHTLLMAGGIKASVINASTIKPLDEGLLQSLSTAGLPYVVLEEAALMGGLGSAICEYCVMHNLQMPLRIFALPDRFIPQGTHDALLASLGLDGASIAAQIRLMREKTA